MAKSQARQRASTRRGRIRIIGGRWRGRHISIPEVEGLRPTPDRVREALFNWLAFEVDGARCLDLFAGTGALGLEALSRGAATVDFVDSSRLAIQALQANCKMLEASGAGLHPQSAASFLQGSTERYDLVFLDPPYSSDLLPAVLGQLSPHLADRHRVYLEAPAQYPRHWEAAWTTLKSGRAGNVSYFLLTRPTDEDET